MSMKINKLEIENVKRVRAVKIEPAANGLTIIGGDNGQGKTSVLDSIAWALGGESFRPSAPGREGSMVPPYLHVVLSNGLVVERKGKNSDLKVTDPSGEKAGQKLLDSFVEKLALNLPKFMEASDTEKAKTLLNIIGVGEQLTELDQREKDLYQERLYVGRTADQKAKFAKEQPYYPDAPKDLISASELIKEQQEILARNGQRQQWIKEYDQILDEIIKTDDRIEACKEELNRLNNLRKELEAKEIAAQKTPKELQMESTEELERNLAEIEEINRKVRTNLDKDKAEEDALQYKSKYDSLTTEIEAVRKEKTDLLASADLPLPELSVSDGKLIYRGKEWDCMSGAEKLKVSTAIVRKLNPECGFVLLDKLEQMDLKTLQEFGHWLEQEGLQAIATRVSTGDECSIIIQDGYAVRNDTLRTNGEDVMGNAAKSTAAPAIPAFKPGVF